MFEQKDQTGTGISTLFEQKDQTGVGISTIVEQKDQTGVGVVTIVEQKDQTAAVIYTFRVGVSTIVEQKDQIGVVVATIVEQKDQIGVVVATIVEQKGQIINLEGVFCEPIASDLLKVSRNSGIKHSSNRRNYSRARIFGGAKRKIFLICHIIHSGFKFNSLFKSVRSRKVN